MGNYKIGYGKPPEHSRFEAGKSGNDKGRPKGRISTARLLEKHMDARVTINVGRKPKKVSRREALVLSAIGDAFKGSEKVRRQFLDLILSFDAQLHGAATPVIDSAQDQAVIDALLYSYGVKTGADTSAVELSSKKIGKTNKPKRGD